MTATHKTTKPSPLGITGTDDKWEILRRYNFAFKDFIHGAIGEIGPWPQPAPDNPVRQIAQVIHLPKSELDDWNKNVGRMYRRLVLTRWPQGLWYIFKHKHYKRFNDSQFNEEISEGLYSKFLTPLDAGDLAQFKTRLPDLTADSDYFKADFSCMEPIYGNCYPGMFAAPTIALLKKNAGTSYGQKHKVVAIYLYSVSDDGKAVPGQVYIADDGKHWELAKYYVLQGAAHRINLTEHALLHFPFDSVNAVTRTVLPKDHLVFKLLFPHLRLSLPVDKAVLENPGSLINREKRTFYSPFCAPGLFVRKLLADGYIGRESKDNSYPAYRFPRQPKISSDTEYGNYLQHYYDVFRPFVATVLDELKYDPENLTEAQQQEWEMLGLWAECINEWIPGFPDREELLLTQGRLDIELLTDVVAMIMWGLSVSHGVDHIAIHSKQSHGIAFRLRVAPPSKGKVPDDWYQKLVTRCDLLSAWFTDMLFYEPHNITLLQEVDYGYGDQDWLCENDKRERLLKAQAKFIKALHQCDKQLEEDQIRFARLDQIPNSIQY